MKKYEIEPFIGVGPVKLGMTRTEVEACLGKADFDPSSRVMFLSGFIVNFDANDLVELIELTKSSQFEATYKGINLLSVKAEEAIAFIEQGAVYDPNDPELGYSYVFKTLQLSLWRSTVPEEANDPDGQHFEAIGIAARNYF